MRQLGTYMYIKVLGLHYYYRLDCCSLNIWGVKVKANMKFLRSLIVSRTHKIVMYSVT